MVVRFSKFSLLVLVILPFYSCLNNRLRKDVEQLMQQRITLSSDWNTVFKGKDTVLTGFTEVPVKLVVWYDSLLCTSCQATAMYKWRDIVNYADSLVNYFSVIYLFTPQKEDFGNLYMLLKADRFDYPIFIDRNATFVQQNPKIPKNHQLHSFLLDKNNRVVMVGSPLHNPTLWELYKRTIQKMMDNDGVLPERDS